MIPKDTEPGDIDGVEKPAGDDEQEESKGLYIFLSLILAVVTGANFTLNTVTINYVIKNGFDLNQANYDANMIQFFPSFFMFMYEFYVNEFPYTAYDTFMASF